MISVGRNVARWCCSPAPRMPGHCSPVAVIRPRPRAPAAGCAFVHAAVSMPRTRVPGSPSRFAPRRATAMRTLAAGRSCSVRIPCPVRCHHDPSTRGRHVSHGPDRWPPPTRARTGRRRVHVRGCGRTGPGIHRTVRRPACRSLRSLVAAASRGMCAGRAAAHWATPSVPPSAARPRSSPYAAAGAGGSGNRSSSASISPNASSGLSTRMPTAPASTAG